MVGGITTYHTSLSHTHDKQTGDGKNYIICAVIHPDRPQFLPSLPPLPLSELYLSSVVVVSSLVLPVSPRVEADAEGEPRAGLQQEAHHLVHALLLGIPEERAGDALLEGRQVLRHETIGLVVLQPPLQQRKEETRLEKIHSPIFMIQTGHNTQTTRSRCCI
jgi:hypothetical protein